MKNRPITDAQKEAYINWCLDFKNKNINTPNMSLTIQMLENSMEVMIRAKYMHELNHTLELLSAEYLGPLFVERIRLTWENRRLEYKSKREVWELINENVIWYLGLIPTLLLWAAFLIEIICR